MANAINRMWYTQFTPKLFTVLRKGELSKQQLFKDLAAGAVVGIVALPLAIAFAIASGVSPDKGLITAIVAGFIVSALGGSRVQIAGPTGAFIVIVFGVVSEHGIAGLTIATLLAGIILILMGFARLGNLLKYIPYPLIVGFTSGIAVIIFSSQIKDFFGLSIESLPAGFTDKWRLYFHSFKQIDWISVLIALGTILISLQFHRITTKLPGTLLAILCSTLCVYLFELPVSTIETSFGEIPNKLPMAVIPDFTLDKFYTLFQPALAIALLGGIESLLSAVVSDGMIGGKHRPNAELIAQGIANCFSSLFGGIPATGAIARTATNIKNGGRTPVAGIVHSLVLLFIMILLAPLAKLIPMACLAGILIVVAYHMSEWRQFRILLKGNKGDVLILLITFFLTVFFDLILAIEVGVVLSSFLLMKRLSETFIIQTNGQSIGSGENERDELFENELSSIPKGIALFEINGALFFGAAQGFQDTMNQIRSKPKVLILRMRNVPFIDATGIYRLKEIIKQFNAQRIPIILSGVKPNVQVDLEHNGLFDFLDTNNFCETILEAIERASELMKQKDK